MHTARRVLRIAPAEMTPRMTEEGTHVGIDRGQLADLTRIRDEEPGFPALAYSVLSTSGSAPIRRGEILRRTDSNHSRKQPSSC